jgi:low affinity Fe/Cu permease
MRSSLPLATRSGSSSPSSFFGRFASNTAHYAGKPAAFLSAALVVMIWGISGPFFHYSDTWQLVINTGTTIITFLMVFLIQNTQNRDTLALQLKLDELILATRGARDELACIEDASDEGLEEAEAAERDRVQAQQQQQDRHSSGHLAER